MKTRLDVLLVERGLSESREKAKAIIMSGNVFVDGQREDKAGAMFPEKAVIEVKGSPLKYVSRGGLKLEKALANFDVDVKDKVCTDVGASTGGFTDCMLQNGAEKVYACASHGVLSGPALERLENSYIEELMVLNTIPMPAGYTGEKIRQLDVAPLFAKAINRVYTETSISSLF